MRSKGDDDLCPLDKFIIPEFHFSTVSEDKPGGENIISVKIG